MDHDCTCTEADAWAWVQDFTGHLMRGEHTGLYSRLLPFAVELWLKIRAMTCARG